MKKPSHDWVAAYAPTTGRILMGGYFLWSGIEAALYFPDAVAQMASLAPAAPLALTLGVVALEVLGGMTLVLGWQTRASALVLALYAIAAGFAYSPLTDNSASYLLAHVAIVGGLLYIAGTAKPRE